MLRILRKEKLRSVRVLEVIFLLLIPQGSCQLYICVNVEPAINNNSGIRKNHPNVAKYKWRRGGSEVATIVCASILTFPVCQKSMLTEAKTGVKRKEESRHH